MVALNISMKLAYRGYIYEAEDIPETITVGKKNLPTRNSLGSYIHPTLQGISNFWKWFGNSKVIDEQGRPRVVYHGTGKDFEEFSIDMGVGKNKGGGAFFTSSRDVAATYAPGVNGGNVMPVYLKLENPVVLDAGGSNWNRLRGKSKIKIPGKTIPKPEVDELYLELGGNPDNLKETKIKPQSTNLKKLFPGEFDYDDDYASTDDLVKWARKESHRGIIFKNVKDQGPAGVHANEESAKPMDEFVVFNPEWIKSALGNSGVFGDGKNINAE